MHTILVNKDCFLRENVSGAVNGECRFRCGLRGGALLFCFDVTDNDVISPYSRDNEEIWRGDAVEVFLSPDGNLERYAELEVSPFGVRFYAFIENPAGGGPRAPRMQTPPFTAHTELTREGYRAEISFPIAALEGFDAQNARLNAFRLDKKRDGSQRLYALNPTLCDSFHRPEYFLPLKNGADR